MALVQDVRQTLFRTIEIGRGPSAGGVCSEGERDGANLSQSKGKRGLRAREQSGGQWVENY